MTNDEGRGTNDEGRMTNDEGRGTNDEGRMTRGGCKIYRGVCKTPLHNIVQRLLIIKTLISRIIYFKIIDY